LQFVGCTHQSYNVKIKKKITKNEIIPKFHECHFKGYRRQLQATKLVMLWSGNGLLIADRSPSSIPVAALVKRIILDKDSMNRERNRPARRLLTSRGDPVPQVRLAGDSVYFGTGFPSSFR
jgi:hypothetical protein